MSRPNTNYRRGVRVEQRAVDLMRSWGYQAKRSPASAGLWDARGDNDTITLLVSCKLVSELKKAPGARRRERRVLLAALREAHELSAEKRNTPEDRHAILRRENTLLELWVWVQDDGWYCQETVRYGEEA